jgi:hypothetical protein
MAKASLAEVNRLELPPGLLEQTASVLQRFGAEGNEGFLLWVGDIEGTVARVRGTIVPPQNPIRSENGVGYFVTGDTLFAVNHYLRDHRLRLLAQVHSHPTEAYHSAADDAYAIVTAEGGFSVVVPYFGRGPARVEDWAVYRLVGARWTRLALHEVLDTFVAVDAGA